MDIVELGKLYMNSVKSTLEDRYHTSLDETNAYNCIEADGISARIALSNFSGTVQDMSSSVVTHYEFLKCLGEIATFIKMAKTEEGNLNIIHGRCVRDGQDLFAIMTESASLSSFSDGLSADEILAWPYPYFCVTLDEALNNMRRKGGFEFVRTDPEFAVEVKPEDIVRTIDELALISENKLNVEPSR